MAQVRPYFLRIGQSAGGHSSTDFMPSAAACRASSSVGIGLKHHCTTDCLMRPFAIFQFGSSETESAAACDKAAVPPATASVVMSVRRVSRSDGMIIYPLREERLQTNLRPGF